MGRLLHLVQPTINGQCINHCSAVYCLLLCSFDALIKGNASDRLCTTGYITIPRILTLDHWVQHGDYRVQLYQT